MVKENQMLIQVALQVLIQPAFPCSKSTTETAEQYVKGRHQNNVNDDCEVNE